MHGEIINAYLFSHPEYVRTRSIIHQRVGKHEVYISLVLQRAVYEAIPNTSFDGLQIHRALDDLGVVGDGKRDWIDGEVEGSRILHPLQRAHSRLAESPLLCREVDGPGWFRMDVTIRWRRRSRGWRWSTGLQNAMRKDRLVRP